MQAIENPLIFVVEDNKVYNRLIVSYLKSNGFQEVYPYFTGEDVINDLHKNPDVVIQDFLLEEMNGIDVLQKSKELGGHAEFIFLSGQDSLDVAIKTLKYGAYDYIVKDQMALKKMVSKINKICSVKKLEESNTKYKSWVVFIAVLIVAILALVIVLIFFPYVLGN